jgi:thioredoxin 2
MAKLDENGVILACPNCGQRNRIRYENLGQTTRCGKCKHNIPGPNAPIDIDSEEHFNLLIGLSSLPVLVDFWAPWCGPCKMAAPEFDKVAASTPGELVVAKVNTDDQPAIAGRFNIRSIPTLILFQGGNEVARTSGARPAAGIQDFVHQSLGQAHAGSR